MRVRITTLFCFATALAAYALSANSDQVIDDDLIVQGSQCVGVDCVDNVDFGGDILRLTENNLRIRFHDTSAPDVLGQSWNLSANSQRNNGKSYFSFELKSLVIDTILLSDGTAPLYDCSVPVPVPPGGLPPIIGVIPLGEPVTVPGNQVLEGSNFIYDCITVPDFTEKPILLLGATADNNVTLGYDSRPESSAVSVGAPGLLRNLKHVAAGIADTDLLITQALNNAYQDQDIQLAELQALVTDLEEQIAGIEDKVFNNQAPTAPVLLTPAENGTVTSSTATLEWRSSSDADGDEIRYRVTICEQVNFSNCDPVEVVSTGFGATVAQLGGGAGLLLFGMVHAVGRRKRWLQSPGVAGAVMGVLIISGCGGGSSGASNDIESFVATGLDAGTTYYWKVSATDFIDTTDSLSRNFTVQ